MAFVILAAVLLGLPQVSAGAETLSETLQKGLFEEEANHNLDAAIKAYQSVLQQTDEQRKLAATAVFRLGECYRKLGKTNEATAQYQRILREFSEQTPLANLSRQNLAGLGAAMAGTEAVAAATDEEEKELQRIKAIIRDSPDLINARENFPSPRKTRLHKAAGLGQLSVAQFLLANGAEVDPLDSNDETPLHWAARSGHKSLVELLLTHNAAVDGKQSSKTPLHLAAANGHKLVVMTLLAHKADVNARDNQTLTPLHLAVVNGYKTVAEVLLQSKVDLNAVSTGVSYAEGANWPIGSTPLHFAAARSDAGMVEWLCAHGADVNVKDRNGNTPLHLAAGKSSKTVIELLLAKKADVDAKNASGATPLLNAASASNAQVVESLLAHGADVNTQDDKRSSPLHAAVDRKAEEMLRLLLAHKPDLNVRDKDGYSPLQRAVVGRAEEIIELLLDAGAPPNVTLKDGNTPLHWAAGFRSRPLVELLLAHKANVNAQNLEGQTPFDLVKLPAGGRAVTAEELLRVQIADLLRKAGASEDLHRLSCIAISRSQRGWSYAWFYKGTNAYNRYTLLELISNFFENKGRDFRDIHLFPFPDFAQVKIQRLRPQGGSEEINVNLQALFQSGDCSKDLPLEWGDVVELPELDHRITDVWPGLSAQVRGTLRKCLDRKVQIIIKGQATTITLRPTFNLPPTSAGGVPLLDDPPSLRENETPAPEGIKLADFRLRDVVYHSKLLLSSSDVTRVKIRRKDAATGQPQQWLFDLTTPPNSNNDLWLRDGDLIEVPEK